jgi:hypothetical protein
MKTAAFMAAVFTLSPPLARHVHDGGTVRRHHGGRAMRPASESVPHAVVEEKRIIIRGTAPSRAAVRPPLPPMLRPHQES